MRTIYKYPITAAENPQVIELPEFCTVLCVQMQDNNPCIWVELDTEEENMQKVEFYIFGTGHSMPEDKDLLYIGTFQIDGGRLIFHLYRSAHGE